MSSSATDQATVVSMPQMGVSVAEGTIVEWLKQPGDPVEADEPVCVVTTDKVDVEIPAPAGGRMGRILVDADETVEVGTPLAEIDGEGASGKTEASDEPAAPAETPAADGEPDRSKFHSPVVQRIAAEHEIDRESLEGTGVGGRVRKRDLLALIGGGGAERPLHTESPYRPEPEPTSAPAGTNGSAANGAVATPGRRERMTPMRRRIAEHMLESRRTSAHCTTIVEADLSAVVGARAGQKEQMAERGVPLTYLAFVARAAVEALQRHPVLNASIEGDEIVYHGDVNLGIAVALDEGLIVPVIERAQRLSLEGIAAAIADLAGRARSGGLEPDDVQGGTFTITNPGQFGAVLATPIINQPQVAILDLEAVVKRPVVVEDDGGADAIAIRPMTNLCMSWDHRALDGAQAARFLGEVKERLESWEVER
jgi:pyruvate/2-oxoglutarate dehydrogenase complex dihydrolipoamide acyltransferase (E2) component